jgi:hypothetical protein
MSSWTCLRCSRSAMDRSWSTTELSQHSGGPPWAGGPGPGRDRRSPGARCCFSTGRRCAAGRPARSPRRCGTPWRAVTWPLTGQRRQRVATQIVSSAAFRAGFPGRAGAVARHGVQPADEQVGSGAGDGHVPEARLTPQPSQPGVGHLAPGAESPGPAASTNRFVRGARSGQTRARPGSCEPIIVLISAAG